MADERDAPKPSRPQGKGQKRASETISEAQREKRLESVRDRLYSRTHAPEQHEQWDVSRSAKATREDLPVIDRVKHHQVGGNPLAPVRPHEEGVLRVGPKGHVRVENPSPLVASPLGSVRTKIIAGSVLFFLLALILSSAFLFFGQNTISGDNISIDVDAPLAVGGGEELSLQIAVTNRNIVPVESATLIVEFPSGTQAAGTEGKELFRERIPLEDIQPGEVLSVPVKARLFGEENDEKNITIFVEYRVEGSNAIFDKEAEPVRIKISSSPVAITLDALKEISSGQDIELVLTVRSNSPTTLTNLLVEAEYPQGFDYTSAAPGPAKGQNIWTISTLEPEEEQKIAVKGIMTGDTAEARTFSFSIGVPSERNPYALASVFTKVQNEIQLTDPFLGLSVELNGKRDTTISVPQQNSVSVSIRFENTTNDPIYGTTINAVLRGNGLNANNIDAGAGGFYNSSANTITWAPYETDTLRRLMPGDEYSVDFTIDGANLDAFRTPQISFDVSVSGRRVSENRVPQQLTNVLSRTVRFESTVSLASHGLHTIGPFENSGPIPPRAEEETTYTIMLNLRNGSNDLADGEVRFTLPLYVSWKALVSSGDDVVYDADNREVVWRIGSIDANTTQNAAFQIGFLPSVSQVGSVPVLVGEQRFRATDRFAGTTIRVTAGAIRTDLSEDPDDAAQDGRIREKQ